MQVSRNETGEHVLMDVLGRAIESDDVMRPVVSLFSGAMGLDIGLEQAGLPSSVVVEIDELCCETIKLNRPHINLFSSDIRDISPASIVKDLGDPDEIFLVAGGPPCQSFSTGGNRAALSDPRGNLIYEYFRMVNSLRPRHFLFENVANIVTAALSHRPIEDRPGKHWNLSAYAKNRSMNGNNAPPMKDEELSGSAIKQLLKDVNSIGYSISFGVVDAADYGSPQHRLRFVMLGSRDSPPPMIPRPTHGPKGSGLAPWRTLRDAIWDLREEPGPHSSYSEEYVKIFEMIPPGGNWRQLPLEMQMKCMGRSYFSGGGKTGFFRRLSWDSPSPTITGKPNRKGSGMCHPEFTRPLSVRECARLQGFPDSWQLVGAMGDQYVQIGNAVPVHLGTALGKAFIDVGRYYKSNPDHSLMLEAAVKRLRKAACNKKGSKSQKALYDNFS